MEGTTTKERARKFVDAKIKKDMVLHECQQKRVVAQLSRNVSISILWVPPPQ